MADARKSKTSYKIWKGIFKFNLYYLFFFTIGYLIQLITGVLNTILAILFYPLLFLGMPLLFISFVALFIMRENDRNDSR